MKRLVLILFYMLFGILVGTSISPGVALGFAVVFPILGLIAHRLNILPYGAIGAGSLTNAAETDFLELLFTNLDWPNIGDSSGLQASAAPGSFYIALYSAAPSDAGGGTELSYTGYARVAVARSAGGWTIAGNNASNTAAITFGEKTDTGSVTGVAAAILTALTAGDMIAWCDLDSNITIDNGTVPEIPIGDLDINVD